MLRFLLGGKARDAVRTEAFEVADAGETFRVVLRRSGSARRFTLRVRATARDVVLTMPGRASRAAAHDFAHRYAGWIRTRLHRLPQPVAIEPGATLPVRGIDHVLLHRPGERGTVWVAAGKEPALCAAGDSRHFPRRVLDYLKREARRDLEAAVARHAAAIERPAPRLTVRDTRSRWGSCSSRGALNFSWRLILAPPFVLDYLAAHEVAHLIHMDHSAAFWRLTRRLAPDTDAAEAWLKTHGVGLHRYGAAPPP